MWRLILAAVAAATVAVVMLGAAGCGAHHLAAKLTCAAKAAAWWHAQNGKTDFHNVTAALYAVANADRATAKAHFTPATVNTVQAATKTLLNAVHTLAGNEPPGCVPGLDPHVRAGLTSFKTAGKDELMAVTAARAKDYNALATTFRNAGKAFKAGSVQFAAIPGLIKAYVKS